MGVLSYCSLNAQTRNLNANWHTFKPVKIAQPEPMDLYLPLRVCDSKPPSVVWAGTARSSVDGDPKLKRALGPLLQTSLGHVRV